jgi:catechol 2,3-dioxygenase-like lactoylglutathione lyase family enzyme
MRQIASVLVVFALCAWTGLCGGQPSRADDGPKKEEIMELGAFSVSLAVKDLKASRAFYEKLGFQAVEEFGGKHWCIVRNGTTTLGLFQGMYERNILTFNPGWSWEAKPLARFQDVRDIQRALRARGLVPKPAADESSTGPASLALTDPDGNPIFLDQHVPRPGG